MLMEQTFYSRRILTENEAHYLKFMGTARLEISKTALNILSKAYLDSVG